MIESTHPEFTPEQLGVIAALDEAIDSAGGVGLLASGIQVATSLPSMWRKRGKVPGEHAPAIERLTRARHAADATKRIVVCERLAPDVDWDVVRTQPKPPVHADPAQATQGA